MAKMIKDQLYERTLLQVKFRMMSPAALKLLLIIDGIFYLGKTEVFAATEMLCREVGVTTKTLCKARKELVDLGLITVGRRNNCCTYKVNREDGVVLKAAR